MEANGMMCPLLTAAEPNNHTVGCYGDGCGFWNHDQQVCGVAAIGRAVSYWMLMDSRDRMTREERTIIHHRTKEASC